MHQQDLAGCHLRVSRYCHSIPRRFQSLKLRFLFYFLKINQACHSAGLLAHSTCSFHLGNGQTWGYLDSILLASSFSFLCFKASNWNYWDHSDHPVSLATRKITPSSSLYFAPQPWEVAPDLAGFTSRLRSGSFKNAQRRHFQSLTVYC